MSRKKIFKNKKSSIKSTISGLTLAIAIGIIGGLGSYAYFTDIAEAKNDLVVTMGNLDVSIDKNELDFKIDKYCGESINSSETINITNTGSLNQELSMSFTKGELEGFGDKSLLSGLQYTLYEDQEIFFQKDLKTIWEEAGTEYKIENRVISPGDKIELRAVISGGENLPILKSTYDDDDEYDIEFDLNVKGIQTNKGGTDQ